MGNPVPLDTRKDGADHDVPGSAGTGPVNPDEIHISLAAAQSHATGRRDKGSDGSDSAAELLNESDRSWYAFFKTKEFYIILLLGQLLALFLTSTNTFTALLVEEGTSIPAFQTFFNYALLNLVYTTFTVYKYGFKKWASVVVRDGWKYFLLAFADVEGNYFVVRAYRDTNILSAQLINFWAIVVVVVLSFVVLRVRYHWSQIVGILVCVGGMGVLLGSDHITGSNGGEAKNAVRGDLFALLGATFYGLSNLAQEFLVSKKALHEVVGQLGFWAMLINGTQAAIFDRDSIRDASWTGTVIGYLVGYTLCLALFYSLVPVLLRLASAAFFNISLLTANFWGVVVGIHVFRLSIHWMYPIAFSLILLGQFVYHVGKSSLGEAVKPWLGRDQEGGVDGVGTARRKLRSTGLAPSRSSSSSPTPDARVGDSAV